jgi:N-acetylmuramoyl-L-alanine amidase
VNRAISGFRVAPRAPRAAVWTSAVLALAGVVLGLGAVGPVRADAVPADRFDVVVVDAGHGGEDEGARGPGGALEKDVVLALAREVSVALRGEGLRVVMTRNRDEFVSLEQRTHIANDADGDLFVSIHANASEDASVRGTETFFLSLRASDQGAHSVAERENRALGAETPRLLAADDPLVAILGNLAADEYLAESQAFARMMQTRLARIETSSSRGVKQAPFVVLDGVQMPAALVELGFITNARDERTLRSERERRSLVGSLVAAVLEFRGRHDAKRGLRALPARDAR